MAIIATYNPIAFDLAVVGDTADNVIQISRNLAGSLFVNGGTIGISGGSPTVANTDLLLLSGGAGNDTLGLDESRGALPAAELAGDLGNDLLTGGSGDDTLLGGVGNDTLLGRAGADLLLGGDGDDLLVGGDGNDLLIGGAGNDRMVWNPGDDSDLMEGGDGTDVVEVNGGGGSETFTLTANGTRVRFDRLDPAPFTLDIGTTEHLLLNAGGGDDLFSAAGNLAALISVAVDGGPGNDTLLGGNGADLLIGGEGDDFLDGNQGDDILFLGAGNDTVRWDPGDGSDVVEGQAGTDILLFNGSGANEVVQIAANGSRARLERNIGNIVLDLADIEELSLQIGGGADSVVIHDLAGSGIAHVTLNLAGLVGGSTGDGQIDTVTVSGGGLADTVNLAASGGTILITGLAAAITLTQAEGTDALTLMSGGGDDLVTVMGLPSGVVTLRLDGGTGNDTLHSTGDGTYLGGHGNDLMFAGLTSLREIMDGSDGIDTLDTRSFNGTYVVNLLTGTTNFASETFLNFENLITGEGRDLVTGTADANSIRTNGGQDTVAGGAGNDTIEGGAGADVLDGGNGIDTIAYRFSATAVAASLATGSGTAGDAAGDSFVNFEILSGSAFADTLGGGASDDTLIGGAGADQMAGGAGNDVYLVDNAGDLVLEALGEGGADLVRTSVSYSLLADQEIERIFAANPAATTGLTLTGNGFGNMLRGNAGANRLNGAGGDDLLQGLNGNDTLNGGSGKDTLLGGAGNDVYIVDTTTDRVFETTTLTGTTDAGGLDTVKSSVTFSLGSHAGVRFVENLVLTGTGNVNGTGNALANRLTGNAANNTLNGGLGNDTLTGGAGRDSFVFSTALSGANIDRITDFNVVADTIRLDDAVFTGLVPGALAATAFAANLTGKATDAQQRILYETDTGRIYFDSDGNGSGARVHFATLTADLALSHADFFVF